MRNREILEYSLGNLTFKSYLSYNGLSQEKRPAVLVVPTWMGLNPFALKQADALADLGYVGFALDLFGEGKVAVDPTEAKQLITPLVEQRAHIRTRIELAYNRLLQHPLVKPNKIAAIGFCFGGFCVLEYAKGGAPILGVVTFHATLGNPNNLNMKPIATAQQIPASILLLHGYKDALAPEEDLLLLERELTERGVDWQVHVYGEAMHAFTNPDVDHPELSLQYHEKTARRAWLSMSQFLTEIFKN